MHLADSNPIGGAHGRQLSTSSQCDPNAACTGGACQCLPGYVGTGQTCQRTRVARPTDTGPWSGVLTAHDRVRLVTLACSAACDANILCLGGPTCGTTCVPGYSYNGVACVCTAAPPS